VAHAVNPLKNAGPELPKMLIEDGISKVTIVPREIPPRSFCQFWSTEVQKTNFTSTGINIVCLY
jgi:hypothetical protein